jgi:C4-dicarboxylate-specific signal transduction histidine kinase
MNLSQKERVEPDSQGQSVLIVDDNPTNLGVLADYLETSGLEVLAAQDGEDGLEKAQLAQPDLILLDVLLPGIDGFETCRRLKADETTKDIPVIFMTVLTGTEHKLKGFQVGGADYVTKPFQQEEVLARVTTHLRLRELAEQLEQKVEERTRELTATNLQLEQEIVERERVEEKLKKSSERLEEMVDERTRELQAAQEQLILQQRLAVLGQLSGAVAHELRNPLGSIKNAVYFLNLLLADSKPEATESLEIMEKEVGTAERIISNLLDLAYPQPPNRRKVNVNDVVHQALSRITIPESIEVAHCLEQTLPNILADPYQLEKVLGSLILNAVQAMSPPVGTKGGQLTIESKTVEPGSVAVSIIDTGVGISKENQWKLFEPFFTTKAKGIGLGLALAENLVETNGGSIEVESEAGQGSTFIVTLRTDFEPENTK